MIFKKLIATAAIIVPCALFAQNAILISEDTKDMSAGSKNCYITLIPQAKAKDVISDWKKMLQKTTKEKLQDNNGETKATMVSVPNISTTPLTVYAKFVESTSGVQLSSWFAQGDSFIATTVSADKSIAVQKYLHDFGAMEYKDAVKNELADEQKKLKELEKTYEGFVKDQKKAENGVTSAQREIEKLQNKNKEEEGNIKQAIANKNSNYATTGQQSDLNNEKKRAKELQGYINDQQKAESNINSNNKKIEKMQDKIKEETGNAEKAKQNQIPARANADSQKGIVQQVSDKLNNIK